MVQSIENPNEDLRAIRRLMERSSRYSNFSATSCVWAGMVSLLGAVAQLMVAPRGASRGEFLAVWGITVAVTLAGDLFITRRRITSEDQAVLVRLTRQMAKSVAPAFAAGGVLTIHSLVANRFADIYPMWVLIYGVVICAASSSAPRQLAWFGQVFLGVGVIAALLQTFLSLGEVFGLSAMALAFGLGHIGYGLLLARKEGW
ncbi:hypothetical protein [Fimbriimonas ginsengisoli]|uniref:Uncharacterized protein n=1 Tax=Fimbriimonas ginsengisoli Gsoil 348 TaxID=661478 RepID=A0A068NXS2_FIMGI|nr:hypothetical protein [Fimbriimonas ginsengisoli]AIE86444.1 hypothetical protein OP10G_3076 [Fimbriimonas ginsengisoli Gsoil 348]